MTKIDSNEIFQFCKWNQQEIYTTDTATTIMALEISSASKWVKALTTTTTNNRRKLDTADMKISVDTEGSKREINFFSWLSTFSHFYYVYIIKQHFWNFDRLINRWSKRNWKLYIKENCVKYKIDYFIPKQFNQINRTINLKSPKNPTLLFWVRLKKRSISWDEWQQLCALCQEFIHLGPLLPLLSDGFHHLVKNR